MAKKRQKNQQKQKGKKTSNVQAPPKNWTERLWYLVLIALIGGTYLLFATVTDNGFLDYQDKLYIEKNDLIQTPSTAIFASDFDGQYQPLTLLSFAFNFQATKLYAPDYHLSNLVLHLLNVILVFYLLFLWSGRQLLIGVVGALFFAIHPMQVEAVAWLSARSILLCSFFLLLSLLSYWRYVSRNGHWWRVGAIFAFLLALLSDGAAIVFPLTLLALDYWRGKKIDKNWSFKTLPFWSSSLIFLVLYLSLHLPIESSAAGGFLLQLQDNCYAFALYLLQFFVPFQLSIFHPSPSIVASSNLLYLIAPVVVLLFIGGIVLAFRSKYKWLTFGLLFFAVHILWALPFFQNSEAVMEEHRAYFAYIGGAFLIAWMLRFLLQNNAPKLSSFGKVLIGGLLIGICGLAYISHERLAIWESDLALWEDAIQKYPEAAYLPHALKGDYYRYKQNHTLALKQYDKAVEINSNYGAVYHRRALAHHHLNHSKAAEADYQKAVDLNENRYLAYANLCKIHRMEGNYEQAMKECNAAIAGDDFEQKFRVYLQRGTMYALAQNYEKALADYNYYIKNDSQDSKAFRWRGIAYYETGNLKAAMKDIQEALNLDPSDAIAYLYRYRLHKANDNLEEARLDSIRAKAMGAPF